MVHPAAGLAHRAGHDVHERGHVVIGHLLALGDLLDRERSPLADRRGVLGGDRAGLRQRVHHGQLHLEPGLELALLGPDGAHVRARVALDQVPRICAASTAAFLALSTPTHATGTPGGIWAIARRASRPPATEVLDVSGTPITGRSVCAATTPGSAAARPGAGDDHAEPAHPGVLGVVGHDHRIPVRAHHADLVMDPPLLQLGSRLLHHGHVRLRPHHDSHPRGVHVEVVELATHLRLRGRCAGLGFAHTPTLSTARAAMSVRICFPSNCTRSAAA